MASLILVSIVLVPGSKIEYVKAETPDVIKSIPGPAEVKVYASKYLRKALMPVAECESGHTWRQFNDDGSVHRGKINPNDVGLLQVNTEKRNGHLVEAAKLGLDVYTLEGNVAFANWLYDHEGLTPWNWSKDCWGGKI